MRKQRSLLVVLTAACVALFAACTPAPVPTTTTVAPVDCRATPAPYVNLSGCYLANLLYATLTDATLEYANLTGAILASASLSDANLIGANLTGASLYLANLTGADLRQANLTRADLRQTNLTRADLTGVIWSNTTCPNGVVQSTPCA
ncbi:MAG: pentapeptide repeat-containing protein [Actinobacteria bacterium]|nr:pentapeptide repeat-containing protein [Actinomycetota bacterium]